MVSLTCSDLLYIFLYIVYIVCFDSAIWSQFGVELGSGQICFMCFHIFWVDDEKMTQNLSFFIYILYILFVWAILNLVTISILPLTKCWPLNSPMSFLLSFFFKFLYACTYKCCQSLSNWGDRRGIRLPQFDRGWQYL